MRPRSVPFQGLRARIRSRSRSGSGNWSQKAEYSGAFTTAGTRETDAKTHGDDEVWAEAWVWRVCLAGRMLNAMLVQTYFNPDEHWQSLEVAHRIVFGYGHLTWEWQRGLRSYVHPLIFAALYKVLVVLHLDNPWFMRRAPRLLQSVFAAVGDLYLFKLSHRLFGERIAHWAISNWFNFYCMSRTLSNSMETVFTTMGLYYWWPTLSSDLLEDRSSRRLGILLAGLACVMRPTSAIIWLYVGFAHLLVTRGKWQYILGDVLPIGILCLGGMTLVDQIMYGKWTIVITNFFRFNFLTSGGAFYGTHPWHWYFSLGLPTMAFTFLPLAVGGMWWSQHWELSGLVAWVLALYSTLGHKEFRFILPILPVIMMFAGYGLAVLELKMTCQTNLVTDARGPPGSSESPSRLFSRDQASEPAGYLAKLISAMRSYKGVAPGKDNGSTKVWAVIVILVLTNVPVALYTSLVHQRGGEAVMEHLAKEAQAGRVDRVLFLMPCHATPFYSSLHKNVPMRFLDCSPSDKPGYVDEADRFMAHPVSFLYSMFNGAKEEAKPSHIVLFDSLQQRVGMFLQTEDYSLNKTFFHAHFPVDRELQGHVLVYTRHETP